MASFEAQHAVDLLGQLRSENVLYICLRGNRFGGDVKRCPMLVPRKGGEVGESKSVAQTCRA